MNTTIARHILQVLYRIEQEIEWSIANERIIIRLLGMYYKSITPEFNNSYNYEPLEKGLEICLRSMSDFFSERQLMYMIEWMLDIAVAERISEAHLLDFGNLLEHIAKRYCIRAEKRALPERVMPTVMKVIASDNLLYSLLGNRVFHNLLDRCNNKLKFDSPTVFFRKSTYNIVLNQCSSLDREMFQRYRELLHKTFVKSVLKHGEHKSYLDHIYLSIILSLVEIPCAYTAAAAVCTAMSIQQAALETKDMELTKCHRFHATVLSIMSLVCYIHKADVFYHYVEKIMKRRSNYAPQLNPPLKLQYEYAQHHILWNKPDFFFVDWECRYGLWTCFKNKFREILVFRDAVELF